jgi:hypothetical protein
MSDVDEDDDVGVGQSVSRNNRGTKGVTELFYFVLALSLNEITVNNESISSEQQFELMTQNCDRWIGLLKTEFGQIYRKFMGEGKVTEEQLRTQTQSDTPKNMHRKAKEVQHYVNNFLQPHWKEPENSASGKGREGAKNSNLPCFQISDLMQFFSKFHSYLQIIYTHVKLVHGMRKRGKELPKKRKSIRDRNLSMK